MYCILYMDAPNTDLPDIRLLRKTGSDTGYPATQKNRIGFRISGYSEKQDRMPDIWLLQKTGSDTGYPATQKNRIGYRISPAGFSRLFYSLMQTHFLDIHIQILHVR